MAPHHYKANYKFLAITLFLSFLAIHASAVDITGCGWINESGTYTLTNNLLCPADAIIINASNVELDCAGHQINYSYSTRGYAVNNSGGYDNITIKNCNIVQGNSCIYMGVKQ